MGEYGQYDVPKVDQQVNFKVGQPAPSMLPLEKIRVAAKAKLEEDDPLFLQYGDIPGYKRFRKTVAQFLTKRYGHKVEPEGIFATNGVTGALSMVCTLFAKAGDTVYAEEPTYFLAKSIFNDFNLNTVHIPMDQDGIDVEKLEERLKEEVPKFLYVVTTAHNPTGRTLAADRREKLVELSIKYNFLLVCDEVYQLLTFEGVEPPPPMFTYDKKGTVLALGSFSKILAPALRVGWMQGSPEIFKRFKDSGMLDSSGGINPVCYGIVEKAITMGILDEHLDWTRKTLTTRYKTLEKALEKHLPEDVTFEKPQGGYFVIVKLPEGKLAKDLLPIAEKHKVFFLPGTSFGSAMQNYLRLSFSYYDAEDIEVGCERLASAIKEFLDEA